MSDGRRLSVSGVCERNKIIVAAGTSNWRVEFSVHSKAEAATSMVSLQHLKWCKLCHLHSRFLKINGTIEFQI